MTTHDDASLEQVAEALAGAPRRAVADVDDLPAEPGLYAFWPGTPEAVARLGLNGEGANQPLYIGLARKSLSRRVGEYLDPAFRRYTSFRFTLETLLLVASHSLVREGVLFQYFWDEGPIAHTDLPFARTAGPALSEWMRGNLAVSTLVFKDDKKASAIEHPVIARLQPLANQNGKGKADRDGSITLSRLDPAILPAFVDWGDAWDVAAGLARSSKRTGTGPLYLRLDDNDSVIGVAWRPGPDTGEEPLELPFELADRQAAREAAAAAMDQWAGAPYGDVDRLMTFLGKNYWVPGVMGWVLGTLSPTSYMTPLSPL